MKKLILLCLIFPYITVSANEVTEDYYDIASEYAAYGKYSDAVNYIDKILYLDPADTNAKEIKEVLQRATNPSSKSYLNTYDKTIAQADIYKKQGNKSKQAGELSAASNDYWAIFSLAELYSSTGDWQNAITCYQKAFTLKPDYAQSYLGIARAYEASGDYKNTINYINKYLTYNTNSDIAYAIRANANMNMNYLIDAENDIKHALDIEENISYLLLEAKILYYKGDYDNAKDKLSLLSRNVQTSEVYKFMGLCDYALNDLSAALLNIDKAIILSDEDETLNSTYNEIKSKLNQQ